MRKLLIPLLVALALPITVKANEAYLILTNSINATVWSKKAQSDSTNTIALPMTFHLFIFDTLIVLKAFSSDG